jgi:N4-gp56 family major capsid protein
MIKYFNLRLHAENTNITGDSGMTVEMKTFYDKTLLKNAFPKLVHNQFGQKKPLPKGAGKIIEFRKFTPLAKALTALSEGVTPDGQKLAATSINATIAQYGAYFCYSDMLDMTTIDPTIAEGTRMLGHQAGESIDTITREVINGGTTVQYGDGTVASRSALVAFNATRASNDYFTCEAIRRAALTLRNNKAMPVGDAQGDFVCIIHPELEYSIKRDPEWLAINQYQNAEKVFSGEIGRFDGVRFVTSTEAKIFAAPNLTAASKNLTVASLATKTFTVDEAITSGEATALVGRHVWIKTVFYTIASAAAGAAGAATITVTETVTGTPGDGEIVYAGDMGVGLTHMPDLGADVGSALFLGSDAYGVTELEGMGLQTIVKQLGSAGSADALNQRATVGWKASHVAKILSELWMVRCEVALEHNIGAN